MSNIKFKLPKTKTNRCKYCKDKHLPDYDVCLRHKCKDCDLDTVKESFYCKDHCCENEKCLEKRMLSGIGLMYLSCCKNHKCISCNANVNCNKATIGDTKYCEHCGRINVYNENKKLLDDYLKKKMNK